MLQEPRSLQKRLFDRRPGARRAVVVGFNGLPLLFGGRELRPCGRVYSRKGRGSEIENRKLLLDHLIELRHVVKRTWRQAKRRRIQVEHDLGNNLIAKTVPVDPGRT